MGNLELDGVKLEGKLTQLVPRERNDGNILVVGFTLQFDTVMHDHDRMAALNAMFGEHCDINIKRSQLPLAGTEEGEDGQGDLPVDEVE